MVTVRNRVRWRDVDAARVVYFLRYPEWAAEGFHGYLHDRGFRLGAFAQDGYGLPYLDTACRYFRPLVLDDEVEIRLAVTDLDSRGFTLWYRIFKVGDPELVAEGKMVRRCVAGWPRKSVEMPPDLRRILLEMAAADSGD